MSRFFIILREKQRCCLPEKAGGREDDEGYCENRRL